MSLDLSGVVEDLCAEFGEEATYITVTGSYDVTTSEASGTEVETSCNAVFYQDRKALGLLSRLSARGSVDTIEGTVAALTAVVSSSQLTGITPKRNDKIERANGEVWTIESVTSEPTSSSYIFGLRRP